MRRSTVLSLPFQSVFPEAGLLNKRLMLSSSFRCDQIYKYEIYDFGHTFLCYLSRTQTFNEPNSGSYISLVNLKQRQNKTKQNYQEKLPQGMLKTFLQRLTKPLKNFLRSFFAFSLKMFEIFCNLLFPLNAQLSDFFLSLS